MAKNKPDYLARMETTKENDEKLIKEGIINFSTDKTINKGFITTKEYASKYNLHPRTVQIWCAEGKIEGAFKFGTSWAIPDNAMKPSDGRYKNGEWVGYRKRNRKRTENTL